MCMVVKVAKAFVYIILRFYAMFRLLFTEILLRLCLTCMTFASFPFAQANFTEKMLTFSEISTNKMLTFYRHNV